MSNWYEEASANDAPKSEGVLPELVRLEYRSGKPIPANLAKRVTTEEILEQFNAGEVGFSFWSKEKESSVIVKEFQLVIVGSIFRVTTFTGGDKNVPNYQSSPVISIKNDQMTLYCDGVKIDEGLYADIKHRLGAESRAHRYLILYSPRTKKLSSIKMSYIVDMGVRRAFYRLQGGSLTKLTKKALDSVNLWNITGDEDKHYVLVYNGVEAVDPDGLNWEQGKEKYIAPVFTIGKVTPMFNDYGEILSAKQSYMGIMEDRIAAKSGKAVQEAMGALAKSLSKDESSVPAHVQNPSSPSPIDDLKSRLNMSVESNFDADMDSDLPF
jgi:hypothetical protein